MPSYIQYKKMMAVLDEDSDIESWITVNGNHIPIRKGQTKEEAVKSFVEKKQGKSGSGEGSASHGSGEYKPSSGGGRINTHIDPYREKAGKAVNDPADDFVTQLYKHKLEKGEYKGDTEKKDPWTPKTKENSRLYIKNGALNYEYTDPDGLHFKVWESGNDYPSWKATNRATELFETREDAIRAAEQQLKEDKTKYGDFTNKRNKDFMWRRYKNGFEDTEPEMGTGEKAKETPKVKEQKPMDKLITSFSDHYDKLYKSQYLDDKNQPLLGEWDKHIKNPEFKKKVQEFVEARGDFISSDREVKAFMLAAKENGLIPAPKEVKQYTYHTDAGHGWLQVPLKELKELGVKPTEYSYKDKENAYLEEDVDGPAFMKAYEKKYGSKPETIEHYNGSQSPIRRMARFKAPK